MYSKAFYNELKEILQSFIGKGDVKMDKIEFGKLVSLLRQDFGWKQFDLHERSGIDLAVISQIERGVKKNFDSELLIKLANTFELTTIERREFFLAASGVPQQYLIRQPSAALATDSIDAKKVLGKMVKVVEKLYLPAFIVDVYSDVLALNNAAIAFFQITPEMVQSAPQIPGGFTTMRFLFGRDLSIKSKITENWEEYAVGSIRFFRAHSLRYRANPYFQYLMKSFSNQDEYPLFERYWKRVSSFEEDREANVDIFSYTHSDFGRLNYATTFTVTTTPYGELFMTKYVPMDEYTRDLFDTLAKTAGRGAMAPLAPWPEKHMP